MNAIVVVVLRRERSKQQYVIRRTRHRRLIPVTPFSSYRFFLLARLDPLICPSALVILIRSGRRARHVMSDAISGSRSITSTPARQPIQNKV